MLLVVMPWAAIQFFLGLVGAGADERTNITCEYWLDPHLLAGIAVVAGVVAILALLLAWARPRSSIKLSAVVAFLSLCWLAGGGWGAAGCVIA